MADRKMSFPRNNPEVNASVDFPAFSFTDMEVARRPTGEQTDEMIERLVELINVQREDLQQTKDLVEMTKRDAERSEQEAKASRRDAKINIWFAWAALILTGGVGIVQIIQSALLN